MRRRKRRWNRYVYDDETADIYLTGEDLEWEEKQTYALSTSRGMLLDEHGEKWNLEQEPGGRTGVNEEDLQ